MIPLAIVISILFAFAVIGLASAARFGRWDVLPAEPSAMAHGDVVTMDPHFHFEISAGALRCGDAGAGGPIPSCAAGVRTALRMEKHGHA
jgi:hypothetical protein